MFSLKFPNPLIDPNMRILLSQPIIIYKWFNTYKIVSLVTHFRRLRQISYDGSCQRAQDADGEQSGKNINHYFFSNSFFSQVQSSAVKYFCILSIENPSAIISSRVFKFSDLPSSLKDLTNRLPFSSKLSRM